MSQTYVVRLANRALRELEQLPEEARARLSEALDDLETEPRPPGARRLVGLDGYRVRKGDYRILYTVDDSRRLVTVYRVGHRREVYRRR